MFLLVPSPCAMLGTSSDKRRVLGAAGPGALALGSPGWASLAVLWDVS